MSPVLEETATTASAGSRVGVREVALLAGVSKQTVSRVLNDHPYVRESTRDRVRDAIGELGYQVNQAARSLSAKKSRMLGVLATESTHFGPAASIAAIESRARFHGRWVTCVYADVKDRGSVSDAISHLQAQSVEGVVIIAPYDPALRMLEELPITVPFVTLHSSNDSDHTSSIDQVSGARKAVAHLMDLGHVRVAHLSGPLEWAEARARRRGFELEIRSHGREPLPVVSGDWTAESGWNATDALLKLHPSAIFCGNDQMALGVLHRLHAEGIAVPGSVSVVGFDDHPDARYYWPSLTTVRQDFASAARRCVDVLLSKDLADTKPHELCLIIRASTGPSS